MICVLLVNRIELSVINDWWLITVGDTEPARLVPNQHLPKRCERSTLEPVEPI